MSPERSKTRVVTTVAWSFGLPMYDGSSINASADLNPRLQQHREGIFRCVLTIQIILICGFCYFLNGKLGSASAGDGRDYPVRRLQQWVRIEAALGCNSLVG
mmetsp:Transcript_8434/g.12433  ORF Transcript_8434/g.12433 Transcript_8434/m.12433 type:complete len:102 (-) Transcript_8434:98-403(-)